MTKVRRIYAVPYVLWLLLFVLAPVLLIVYQSFFDMSGTFTLANYQDYFRSGKYLTMTLNSIWYAFLITFITFIISYPTAYYLTKLKHINIELVYSFKVKYAFKNKHNQKFTISIKSSNTRYKSKYICIFKNIITVES